MEREKVKFVMKILILNTNIGYGGASKMLAFVANALYDFGHEVTFLTYRDKESFQNLHSNVKHEHLPLEKPNQGGGVFKTIRALRKYIKANQFDVAIAFLTPSQLRLVPACWGTKTKVLLSQRGDPYVKAKGLKNKLTSFINKFIFCKADYFVFQTEKARDFYPRSVRKKSAVIPNPIAPLVRSMARAENELEKKFVSVARLELKQKRQDLLINAFLLVNKEYPEYSLDLYGDGEDAKAIEEMASVNPNIHLCGVTNNVAGSIQNATALVLSSDYEGIPNVLLEAMSIGVPVISTDCSPGGAAMLIDNYQNGILVERDNVLELYKAMKFAIENPGQREEMAMQGKQRTENFSPERIKGLWKKAIEQFGEN